MTKKEMMTSLHEKTGYDKIVCEKVYDAFIDTVYESLNYDTVQNVLIPKLGTLKIKLRPPFKGRNPKNGETVIKERTRLISFTLNPKIKRALKQPYL